MLGRKERFTADELTNIDLGLKLLEGWNFKFDSDSVAASVFSAWEFAISSYLHESKISSVKIRQALA